MVLRFHIDWDTGLPHFYKHGVTEEEVRQVMVLPGENRRGSENSWVKLGRTFAGRYLRVIYVMDKDAAGAFVVTAFEIHGKPLKAFKRRNRRKHK